MKTYTLLLVDDEEEVIQVILKKINWESLGFSVIGHADNGLKALEMMEEFQPDVVITDIRMPYMDGMELSGRIKTEFPATKILIFTGFDEFEYAKEAIHLEIEEYILKPFNSAELTEILRRLKAKLDQEIHEKRSVEILQKYYMDSLPLLQVDFYRALIEGRLHEEEIPQYFADYQLVLDGPYYCCLVIHTSVSQVPENMNPKLLAASVEKQVMERLGGRWHAKVFTYLGNTVLIVQMKSKNKAVELTDECDRFCKYAKRIIGAVVTVGVGDVCENITELAQSYSSAREAVSYRVLYGSARAINMKEIAPRETGGDGSASETELSNLFKMIRLGSEEKVEEAVRQYLNHMFLTAKSLQQHYVAVMELMSAFYRFVVNNDIDVEDFSGDMKQLGDRLLEMEEEPLKRWLTDVSFFCHRKIAGARSNSAKTLIRKGKEYVYSHYSEEGLSLDAVCEALGVSNSYFSTVFKKETGKSFIGYLTDYRMEKAARMLMETNEKSYMVARSVGYTDANYFSYVFKRQFGVSPSKYRTEYTVE